MTAELTATDIAQAATLQTRYFNYLCSQAGLPSMQQVAGGPYGCSLPLYDRGMWTLIVQQGMNDIDRRCDAYLEWLDNLKRSKGPLISQSNAISATAQAIIEIVSPGSSAIAIVGQAFGLLNQSIENYHSRLLLEVESSTINSIVLKGRSDFRTYLRDNKLVFGSRPEAEHALRSYLRLCLPFAIESKVNNFATLGANGERPDAGNTLGDLPVVGMSVAVGSGDFAKKEGGSGEGGIRKPPPEDKTVDTMYGPNSGKQIADVHADQARLCVSPQGPFGDKTWTAIAIYRRDQKLTNDPTISGDGPFFDLTKSEQKIRYDRFVANEVTGGSTNSDGSVSYCKTKLYINFHEATFLQTQQQLEVFTRRVNDLNIEGIKFDTAGEGALSSLLSSEADSPFRKTIAKLRTQLGSNCGLTEILKDGQAHVTKNLDTAILNKKDGRC